MNAHVLRHTSSAVILSPHRPPYCDLLEQAKLTAAILPHTDRPSLISVRDAARAQFSAYFSSLSSQFGLIVQSHRTSFSLRKIDCPFSPLSNQSVTHPSISTHIYEFIISTISRLPSHPIQLLFQPLSLSSSIGQLDHHLTGTSICLTIPPPLPSN